MVCGDLSIELKREEESESYTVRDLLVTNNRVRTQPALGKKKTTLVVNTTHSKHHLHTHPNPRSTRFEFSHVCVSSECECVSLALSLLLTLSLFRRTRLVR